MKDTGTDLIIMMDSSVPTNQFDKIKGFAKRFIQEVNVDNGEWRVGTMTFDSRPRTFYNLNR